MDFLIPLANGGSAVVDACDAKYVSDYAWRWQPPVGVKTVHEGQTLLLHAFISPHRQTSFRNGDKRDCRRANLMPFKRPGTPRNLTVKPSRTGNVNHRPKIKAFVVRRKVKHDGEMFVWDTRLSYKRRCFLTTRAMAVELANGIMSLSCQDFVEFIEFNRRKRSTHEIISDWSCFDGATVEPGDLHQFGIFAEAER